MNRRSFVLSSVVALVLPLATACKREERCKNCGMRIDPTSPWRTELVSEDGKVTSFDTPRCAFQSWRSGATAAKTLRIQDYYDRQWREGPSLRFMIGGDVTGPMGPDLVPVDPSRASKFIQDHGAERALREDEVTASVLANLK